MMNVRVNAYVIQRTSWASWRPPTVRRRRMSSCSVRVRARVRGSGQEFSSVQFYNASHPGSHRGTRLEERDPESHYQQRSSSPLPSHRPPATPCPWYCTSVLLVAVSSHVSRTSADENARPLRRERRAQARQHQPAHAPCRGYRRNPHRRQHMTLARRYRSTSSRASHDMVL